MKLFVITALAVVALLAGVTGGMLRTHSVSTRTAGMPLMQDLQHAAGGDRLPVEDFEDRSLVFPREIKH